MRILRIVNNKSSKKIYQVRIERCWVKMKDKTKIGLTLYFPSFACAHSHCRSASEASAKAGCSHTKFPVILQASPYRKDDDNVHSGLEIYTYFAERGYVGCQMDVRGTGVSEGIFQDEYSKKEFKDIIEIINWLSKQPWSNGKIGMWGISYSGINSLFVAGLNPAPLKAIISVCATDNRYRDDIHYYGGCLQCFENIWSGGFDVENIFPPYPNYSLQDSRFLKRFNSCPLIFKWLKHQTDSSYWHQGSLAPNYKKIKIPVFLIGGWLDGYTTSLKRMFENLKGPKKALVGPWPHSLPDKPGPWPSVDWKNQALRWWDYWLKRIDNKIIKEPKFFFYLQSYYPPTDFRLRKLKRIPGAWYGLNNLSFSKNKVYWLAPGNRLREETSAKTDFDKLKYDPTVGTTSKTWAPNSDGSYGVNQEEDDRATLFYETRPLSKKIKILGAPKCALYVSSPVERTNWVVRINDLSPNGASRFVTRGVLNGTHRRSHEKPIPLVPNKIIKLEIETQFISWTFEKGHKIRLVISNGEWPTIWPSPYKAETKVYFGEKYSSKLELPLFNEKAAQKRKIKEISTTKKERQNFKAPQPIWKVKKQDGRVSVEFKDEYTTPFSLPLSKRESEKGFIRFRKHIFTQVNKKTPEKAVLKIWADIFLKEKKIYAKTEFKMHSDKNFFYPEIIREIKEKNKLKFSKKWKERIKRNGL